MRIDDFFRDVEEKVINIGVYKTIFHHLSNIKQKLRTDNNFTAVSALQVDQAWEQMTNQLQDEIAILRLILGKGENILEDNVEC